MEIKSKTVVISGPSGSGKGTVIDILIKNYGCRKAVSVTTRNPRESEIDGIDYFFISRERFEKMRAGGELLEYNYYNGNGYGTPCSEIERAERNGECLVLDIDVHGAANVKKINPKALLIFLIPPSGKIQLKRLMGRGTNDEESVRERIAISREELKCVPDYDCVIVNDNLEEAVADTFSAMCGSVPPQNKIPGLIAHYFDEL